MEEIPRPRLDRSRFDKPRPRPTVVRPGKSDKRREIKMRVLSQYRSFAELHIVHEGGPVPNTFTTKRELRRYRDTKLQQWHDRLAS